MPELAALEQFHFLRPVFGILLVPWLALVVMQRRRNRQDMFGNIIAPHLLEHLRLQRFESRRFNPRSVASVFAALVLILLMGPSWRQQPSPLSQDEAAVIVVLDISASMQQEDIQPSRLRRGAQKISDLLALRPDKKAALVAYAGTAHTVLSLTADRDILNQYLAAISPGIMPRSGKFPEYALPLIGEILRDNAAPATIVLFTDGAGADSKAAFEQYFAIQPHQLVIVGVGREQVEERLIPLERNALQALASASDGHYVDLTVDDTDMQKVNRRIDSHYVIVENTALPWFDSGYPLVFPALLLFLLWFRKGWTLTWAWMIVPLILTTAPNSARAEQQQQQNSASLSQAQHSIGEWVADLWLTRDQQGRLLMQLGRYTEAAGRFTNPVWKGMAYYYTEEFMLAADYFSRRDSDDALFNEANARAQGRDYARAVNRYDRLLTRTPDYPGATQNRERVQEIIDEINRLSESQQQEQGLSGEDKALGGDDALPTQGTEELSWEKAEIKHYTADEILQDPATRDMWLSGVQQDPSNFLGIKFAMQLQNRMDGEAP